MAPKGTVKKSDSAVKKPKAQSGGKKKSAWIVFCNEMRPVIKAEAENAGLSGPNVMKELSMRWKDLGESEQARYKE